MASRPCGEDESEILSVVVEPLHQQLALLDPSRPVQPEVNEPVKTEERLQNVQHFGHLHETKTKYMHQ